MLHCVRQNTNYKIHITYYISSRNYDPCSFIVSVQLETLEHVVVNVFTVSYSYCSYATESRQCFDRLEENGSEYQTSTEVSFNSILH